MLERPGACIPPTESIFSGSKPALFGVLAVVQTRMLTLDATELAMSLGPFEEVDRDVVCDALEKEEYTE